MNKIAEINRIHELFDIYGSLLTDKQKDTFELYYFEDLSLAEIAEELNVSRNAVHNNLQATLKHLNNFEDKLQLLKFKRETRKLFNEKDELNKKDIEYLKKLIDEV